MYKQKQWLVDNPVKSVW